MSRSNVTPRVRNCARYRVRTPKATTSSNEGLNNNPALVWPRKNKKGVVVQHPELVTEICDQPGCNGKLRTGLRSKKISSRSIAHFTHSDDDKHSPQKLADTDLDGESKQLFIKRYDNVPESQLEYFNATHNCVKGL